MARLVLNTLLALAPLRRRAAETGTDSAAMTSRNIEILRIFTIPPYAPDNYSIEIRNNQTLNPRAFSLDFGPKALYKSISYGRNGLKLAARPPRLNPSRGV
jgi:hypothetical protein